MSWWHHHSLTVSIQRIWAPRYSVTSGYNQMFSLSVVHRLSHAQACEHIVHLLIRGEISCCSLVNNILHIQKKCKLISVTYYCMWSRSTHERRHVEITWRAQYYSLYLFYRKSLTWFCSGNKWIMAQSNPHWIHTTRCQYFSARWHQTPSLFAEIDLNSIKCELELCYVHVDQF